MIREIEIRNYKCLVNKKITVGNLNFFAGGNAVGKSSFIQAILLLRSAYSQTDKGEVQLNDFYGTNLGLAKNAIATNHDDTSQIEIKASCYDRNIYHAIYKVGEEITMPFALEIVNREDIERQKKESNSKIDNISFTYLNAERIGPRIALDMGNDKNLNIGFKGEYTNHVINKADKLRIDIHDNLKVSVLDKFSAHCQEWLNTIIPGIELSTEVNENVNKAIIQYKNNKTSSEFYTPTGTGFGITYTLPIIVGGLLASKQKDSIFIVENPEAHLHPSAQSNLGKFLALLSSTGIQLFIETHSEHIINGARLQLAKMHNTDNMHVFFFSNEGKSIDIDSITLNEYGELDHWPIGFFDQSKIDLRELVRLRMCGK
ncbi:hypothetical protein CS063_14895 [Sporanaerobium hydrogeniformans]|uniref:Uncharacterized protein n=1 Tax=Sporanaerobium hydrogeniformans TaxID=3072179 RepID=A0AC61D9Y9_9FIRM|nr:DUF3696 domain-containing protein [Sporanaerobium hydrogeniformans]PHV69595.1 hypothetical protein CS063_14895 [Sporanaerobium hydrogeniformans]